MFYISVKFGVYLLIFKNIFKVGIPSKNNVLILIYNVTMVLYKILCNGSYIKVHVHPFRLDWKGGETTICSKTRC